MFSWISPNNLSRLPKCIFPQQYPWLITKFYILILNHFHIYLDNGSVSLKPSVVLPIFELQALICELTYYWSLYSCRREIAFLLMLLLLPSQWNRFLYYGGHKSQGNQSINNHQSSIINHQSIEYKMLAVLY